MFVVVVGVIRGNVMYVEVGLVSVWSVVAQSSSRGTTRGEFGSAPRAGLFGHFL